MRTLFLLPFLLLFGLCARAGAEVTLEGGRWQLPVGRGPKPVWHDVSSWLLPPGAKTDAAPRLLLSLRNLAKKADEAVLLRYAVSARLARTPGTEGTWTLPCILEDRRVPQIRSGELREVPVGINRAVLGAYLRRMERAGFWPDALRLQVTVEPRPGESSFEGRTLETILPVIWKQEPAKGGAQR